MPDSSATAFHSAPPPRGRWLAAGAVAVASLLVRAPLIEAPGFPQDQAQHILWAAQTKQIGMSGPYVPTKRGRGKYACNYPPGYLYSLRATADLYDRLAPADEPLDESVAPAVLRGDRTSATRRATALLKLPAILADAILGALLVNWLARVFGVRQAALAGGLYVLLPCVVHNSAVWGQIDAIPALFIVASLEMARRRRIAWMSSLAALAVLTKPQAMIIVPLWLVVACRARVSTRERLLGTGAVIAVAAALLWPVRISLDAVWHAYYGAAGSYPYTHLNGFSIWFLGNPLISPHLGEALIRWYHRDDLPSLFGLAPRAWGTLAFGATCGLACVALWRRRCDEPSLRWAARLVPLAFFAFSTQMHERYIFTAVAVWAWALRPTARSWVMWLLLGACASVNVLWAWPGPPESAWAVAIGHALQRNWLGVAPGVWCSMMLVGLLAATLAGWSEIETTLPELLLASPPEASTLAA